LVAIRGGLHSDSQFEALGGEPVEAKLRSITGNILANDYVIAEPQNWYFRYYDELAENLISGTGEIQFAQLLQPNAPALNMALPAFGLNSCTLVVTRQADSRFSYDAHLENKMADLLLRYSQKGYQEQAALTATTIDAEQLLMGKFEDPIAAAVGAYSLLRFGELERLHEWTVNLQERFAWLPDGAAIRGEHLARRGNHAEALTSFLKLSDRGLPLFSDGLSYAVERLRLYLGLKEGTFEEEKLHQARSLLETLHCFAACTDFREPITTFTGLTPHMPDDVRLDEVITIENGLDLAQIFG
jgi:hypothetical protein